MFQLFWSFVLIISLSCVSAQGNETTVDLNENAVIYHGKLSPSANQKLLSILKNGKSKVEWLSITPEGGEINHGMDLGNIVHDYDLKLEINEYCLSSCANYFFLRQIITGFRITQLLVSMVVQPGWRRK